MSTQTSVNRMEKIVSLCKRRGFIFQSSEIYGGLNGFWDYGPLGAELKRNVKELWWKSMTRLRDDIVGLEATIIMHPNIWKASGHVDTFSDPMSTCRACKKLVRSDQVWEMLETVPWAEALRATAPEGKLDSEALLKWAKGKGARLVPNLGLIKDPEGFLARLVQRASELEPSGHTLLQILCTADAAAPLSMPCPHCGGELTEPRPFNLMFKTYVGPAATEEDMAYLRPETAQAIFVQFKNVVDSTRVKVPFGICQIGKAFRNEVTPRNFTFRSREFEQMELEFFIKPDEVVQAQTGSIATLDGGPVPTEPQPNWGWEVWHKYWVEERFRWYESIGLKRSSLEEYWQKPDELAHYARATVDILYKFPFGTQELEGIAARSNFDLTQHQTHSGKSMEYFDQEANLRYVPHVIEPSAGVDRLILALLSEAYEEEEVTDEKGNKEVRTVLRFHPRVAPIKAGIFPLLKNKPDLVSKALEVRDLLRPLMHVFYDDGGAIGRRYRRQDEAGTPFCITIDFDTIGENGPEKEGTVTLRHRDSMTQERIRIADLPAFLMAQIS
ncbi:MAG: glycyl-tRNA synthetase [Verrucomicrobia bacterium]|nr:MAG: glycyl-tRNA synthetase [Verrucomicrobiota bacterium]